MPNNYIFCNIQLLLISRLCHVTQEVQSQRAYSNFGKEQCCRHVRPNSKNYLTKTRWNHWTISASYAAIAKLRLRHYAKLRRKYTKSRRSYAKIRRKYAQTKIKHFWFIWPGLCGKKGGCSNLRMNPHWSWIRRGTIFRRTCPKYYQLALRLKK